MTGANNRRHRWFSPWSMSKHLWCQYAQAVGGPRRTQLLLWPRECVPPPPPNRPRRPRPTRRPADRCPHWMPFRSATAPGAGGAIASRLPLTFNLRGLRAQAVRAAPPSTAPLGIALCRGHALHATAWGVGVPAAPRVARLWAPYLSLSLPIIWSGTPMQNPHGLVGTDTPTTARMYLGCLSSTALRSVRTHWREPAAGSGTRRDGEHSLRCCGAEGTLSVAVRPVVPGPVTVRPALTTWPPAGGLLLRAWAWPRRSTPYDRARTPRHCRLPDTWGPGCTVWAAWMCRETIGARWPMITVCRCPLVLDACSFQKGDAVAEPVSSCSHCYSSGWADLFEKTETSRLRNRQQHIRASWDLFSATMAVRSDESSHTCRVGIILPVATAIAQQLIAELVRESPAAPTHTPADWLAKALFTFIKKLKTF